MLNDMIPITFTVPKGTFNIRPIGDLHYGASEFRKEDWEKYINDVSKEKNTYFVLVGDLINNALKNSLSDVYMETCNPSSQKEWLLKTLEPIKNRIICGVGGNHERRTVKDVNIDPLYDIFLMLGIGERYRSGLAVCYISFKDAKSTMGRKKTFCICVTHGNGGGKKPGGAINIADDYIKGFEGVDVMFVGHTHKPITYVGSKVLADYTHPSRKLKLKKYIICSCSSWMSYSGYPVHKMLPSCGFTPNQKVIFHIDGDMEVVN